MDGSEHFCPARNVLREARKSMEKKSAIVEIIWDYFPPATKSLRSMSWIMQFLQFMFQIRLTLNAALAFCTVTTTLHPLTPDLSSDAAGSTGFPHVSGNPAMNLGLMEVGGSKPSQQHDHTTAITMIEGLPSSCSIQPGHCLPFI